MFSVESYSATEFIYSISQPEVFSKRQSRKVKIGKGKAWERLITRFTRRLKISYSQAYTWLSKLVLKTQVFRFIKTKNPQQKSAFQFFKTYCVTNSIKGYLNMNCDLWRSHGRIFAHWTCLYFSLCLWVEILCPAFVKLIPNKNLKT